MMIAQYNLVLSGQLLFTLVHHRIAVLSSRFPRVCLCCVL